MEGVKVQIVLAEKQHLWRRHEQSGAAESDTIHSRRLCQTMDNSADDRHIFVNPVESLMMNGGISVCLHP